MQFPVDADGKRSTTNVAKRVWSAAVIAACKGDSTAANDIAAEKNWRHGYGKHVVRHSRACISCMITSVRAYDLSGLPPSLRAPYQKPTLRITTAHVGPHASINTGPNGPVFPADR